MAGIYDFTVADIGGRKVNLDRQGRVVARYAPTDTPEALQPAIEKL